VTEADKLEVERYFREVSTIIPPPRIVQISQEKFMDLYGS
jgi:hypothetical protein